MNQWFNTSLTAEQFWQASEQTLIMVGVSFFIGSLLGLFLGILLLITRPGGFWQKPLLYKILNPVINIIRSLPFIILLVAIIPFTRLVVGTSIGTKAAIVPLVLYIAPYIARLIENSLLSVSHGIIEAAQAMGASNWQIIRYFILPEAKSSIILSLTTAIIGLVGATAMAGAVGGGGIGDLALNYGYQRFDNVAMVLTVIALIILVQLIQSIGNWLAAKAHKG